MGERKRRGRWLTSLLIAALMVGMMPIVGTSAVAAAEPTLIFINELHYDNTSTDAGEAIEVAAPTGTDLTGWTVVLYNGSNGLVYDTDALGTAVGTCGSYDLYAVNYAVNGLQNGAPDGLALIDGTGAVIQFLSYEGALAALGGPALGLVSTDIGVSEAGFAPAGNSLQLSGTGTMDSDFVWQAEAPNTFGACNTNQTLGEIEPKINEFSASTAGTDVEFVEIYGEPDTDLSTYAVLEIEGDAGSYTGVITEVIPISTTDASGFYLASLPANALQNGTLTLLLVENFTGALNDDIDTDGDGVIDDSAPWDAILDSVGVNDGGAGDLNYGLPVLGPNYDGVSSFAPGGASRIPDGADTESATDWVRNDFDLAGIPTYTGTIGLGEAYNTPGTTNQAYTPPPEACGDAYTPIYTVQGSGLTSPITNTEVAVEGVVLGDFQNNASVDDGDLNGFHLQDPTGDSDPMTSDGIFIYYPSGSVDVRGGDRVRARGIVSEFNGMTEITASQVWYCSTMLPVLAPATLSLPVGAITDFEQFEGMLVTFPQTLVISEYFNYDRYNEIVLTSARQNQPTAVFDPGSPEAAAVAAANLLDRVTLEDGRSGQNPATVIHPDGGLFTMDHRFRGGDTVANVTGILEQYNAIYRVQRTESADYVAVNVRPAAPEAVGGDATVASFNVLNYFTTLDTIQEPTGTNDPADDLCGPVGYLQECRGADTPEELVRQRAKLVAALAGIDADVVGLMEIENAMTDGPTEDLVAGLNDAVGAGTYATIATGAIGTDAIRQALIYKPAEVTPVGSFAILDSAVDPRFVDTLNRPALAQAFQDNGTGAVFTVAVNHLKSKGSACPDDPLVLDESGMCNLTRTAAAEALVDWLATDPTGSGDGDALIIGDLNSYDKETPIDAILAGGYTDLIAQFQGETAYSYVFDSQIGYLDHALANATLAPQVTGTTIWHTNADEPDLIDYDMSFKSDGQDALYAPDAYRSSDHDATLVGLAFAPELALSKAVEPAAPNFGEAVTYTVTLSNTGGLDDTVVLTDVLPAGVTFAQWVEQPGGAMLDAGTITWTGTLTEGHSLTLSFVVTNTVAQASVTNTATFSGTLETGSASAVYAAGGWKVWLPLVARNPAP